MLPTTGLRPVSLLLFCAVLPRFAAADARPAVCPCDAPVLRAATFDTSAAPTAPYVSERMGALAAALPQVLADEQLDVVCLNELWEPSLRTLALQSVAADPAWRVFQPSPPDQPGCAKACFDYSTDPNFYPIFNQWVLACSLTTIPQLGHSCSALDGLAYEQCVDMVCPDMRPYLRQQNPTCGYCLADDVAGESTRDRVLRCASAYDATAAAQCRVDYDGEVDATLLSRLPFAETEFHPLGGPASSPQRGVTTNGVAYGKIATAGGPVHVFCTHLATADYGLDASVAESLNAAQSQEILDYVRSKANGEVAVVLGDTGSGPALASSPSGAVSAQWPANFALLATELTDALSGNLDAASQPAAAAACTYGCGTATPTYVDHVMTSGETAPVASQPRYRGGLCHRNGGVLFSDAVAATTAGPQPLSDHLGVRTDVCADRNVAATIAGTRAAFSEPGDPAKRKNTVLLGDTGIALAGVDPRVTGATAYVGREGVGTAQTLPMPAAGWTRAKSKTASYRFKSTSGPVVAARLIDGKLVQVTAKGAGAYALGTPQGAVGVIVDVGTTRFCGVFGGTIAKDDGRRFVARGAPVASRCPTLGAGSPP